MSFVSVNVSNSSAMPPASSCTSHLTVPLPLALATVLYFRPCNSESVCAGTGRRSLASMPGEVKPLRERREIRASSVLSPNSGLEPGNRSKRSIAFQRQQESQLTTSPNGSFTRMPSKNTERPSGVPISGLAVKPR